MQKTALPLLEPMCILTGNPLAQVLMTKGSKNSQTLPGATTPSVLQKRDTGGTRKITVTKSEYVIIQLNDSKLIPLVVNGPVKSKIDIVFIPSTTTYNCNLKKKIPIDTYSVYRQRFVNDVTTKMIPLFSRLDTLTSAQVGIPRITLTALIFIITGTPEIRRMHLTGVRENFLNNSVKTPR